MAFRVRHRYGAMTADPPRSVFAALLRELDERPEDGEHASVGVTHETEWDLSASRGGTLVLEHLEEGEPRHMRGVEAERIIALWNLLADGDLAAVEREAWQAGY